MARNIQEFEVYSKAKKLLLFQTQGVVTLTMAETKA